MNLEFFPQNNRNVTLTFWQKARKTQENWKTKKILFLKS